MSREDESEIKELWASGEREFMNRRKPPVPKPGPDLCAACEHERDYHNAAGCGIEQCACQEFTRTPSGDHCACLHDGRGGLSTECQEHREIRKQRDQLLAAIRDCAAVLEAILGRREEGFAVEEILDAANAAIAAVA